MKKFKAQLNAYCYRVKWNMYLYESEIAITFVLAFILLVIYVSCN